MVGLRSGSLLFVLAIAVAAGAQPLGKTTVDPNTRAARVADSVDAADKRLSRPVTCDARKKTVLAILTDLSATTGVKLRAGYSSQDWQVRDRKMTVIAEDLRLSTLMDSIARVMHFKWQRGGKEGDWTYRLFMDRKAILDCDARRDREERQRTESRGRFVADCLDACDLSEQEMAKLREDDPARYILHKTGISSSLGALFREMPAAAQALSDGTELYVRPSEMSEAAQEALLRFMGGVLDLSSSTFSEDRALSLEGRTLRINRPSLGTRPAFVLGVIVVSSAQPDESFGFPVIDPDSRTAKADAKSLITCMDENRPPDDTESPELHAAIARDTNDLATAESQWTHPDAPALLAKIKVEDNQLHDTQAAIAEAAELAVVSDSFPSNDGTIGISGNEIELKTVLNTIQDRYWYNWAKHGAVVEFQDRDWLKKRAVQIPDAWLEGWRSTLEKNGVLGIDTLAQMAMLASAQLSENVAADELLGGTDVVSSVSANQEILRLYASLSDTQRKMLISPTGLDFVWLTPPQQLEARSLIASLGGQLSQEPAARVLFSATGGSLEGRRAFTISVTVSDGGTQPLTWRIPLPVLAKSRQ